MNEQEELFPSEDNVDVDKELIAALWREFDAIIENRGKEPELDEGEDRGPTFERLKYIINQIGLGNILERAEFQKQIEQENSNLS